MSNETQIPDLYVVDIEQLDPHEVMFNVGRGVQTLVADEQGLIVAAVVPVQLWYPGAAVPPGVAVKQPGDWLRIGLDEQHAEGADQ